MKFGIHIGHMGGPLGEMRKLWKFADAKGFDWFSVSDHFQESPPRGGDMDCYEAIATLAAAAMDTTRVRLGSGVYCVAYRNPGLLAKSLTTIDHLSNGRVDCGLGAGWHDVEAKAYGIPFPSIGPREDMLEEYAQILRLLLDPEQRRASFDGKHFRLADAPNNPKPLQPRIPIWIGGRGEKRTLRAAAKYADGWNGAYMGPDDWKHKSQVLDRWCETEGRDPKTIMRTVNLGFYLGADAKGAARADEIFKSHWGGSADRADRTGYLRGTVKDARAMVDQFRALGCTRLCIAFREGPYDWEALEAFEAERPPLTVTDVRMPVMDGLEFLKRARAVDSDAVVLVLTGGGARLAGVAELARDVLEMPVRVATPQGVGGLMDQLANPAFSTSLGLLLWGARHVGAEPIGYTTRTPMSAGLSRAGTWIRNLFPA